MTPIPQAAIEAMKDDIKRQIKESLGAYFGDEADGTSVGIEGVIDLGRLVSAALPHLGEPVAWQYRAGIDGWKQCHPEFVACYRRYGMIVRPLYAAPPAPAVKIKPLEWIERTGGSWVSGLYVVFDYGPDFTDPVEFSIGRQAIGKYETVEDAKVAAQADHERRILAAIEGGQTTLPVIGGAQAIRNAALEEAATLAESCIRPAGWREFVFLNAAYTDFAAAIRALKAREGNHG